MTRLAVLSDIHGNLPALEAVMADMAQFAPDHVVVVGDVVNWGPSSAAVMEIVHNQDWSVIRGNNEYYLLDYNTPRQPAHWRDYVLIPWLHDQLKGRWHRILAGWPDEITLRFPDAPPVRVFHGMPGNPWTGLHPLMDDATLVAHLTNVQETTVIGGHTHLALDRYVGRWHVLNPSTVGCPLDGDSRAAYMLLDGDSDGWRATFRRVEYDVQAVLNEFSRQGFVERCGPTASLVVREFATARMQLYPFQLWRKATYGDLQPTDTMIEEFLQSDPWPYIAPEYHINLTSLNHPLLSKDV